VITSLLVITTAFPGAGSTWIISPALFVRGYRRIEVGDFYAQTPDWERAVFNEGRFGGFVFFGAGLVLLYFLLKVLKII